MIKILLALCRFHFHEKCTQFANSIESLSSLALGACLIDSKIHKQSTPTKASSIAVLMPQLVFVFGVTAIALTQSSHAAEKVQISNTQIIESPESTKIRIEARKHFAHRVLLLDAPARIVIDFPHVAYSKDFTEISSKLTARSTEINAIRHGQFKPNVIRLVLDMHRTIVPRVSTVSDNRSYVLTIEIDKQELNQKNSAIPAPGKANESSIPTNTSIRSASAVEDIAQSADAAGVPSSIPTPSASKREASDFAQAADGAGIILQAKALLQGGKSGDAYNLLEKQADSNSANIEYNYLLGIAALDSAKPGIAVFAFERALAINAEHLPARAELARAYLALGESGAAKEELSEVSRLNPPLEVARTVGDFLKDIDIYEQQLQAAASTSRGWSGYVQMDNGFDTNINTATNLLAVNVPLFGNLPLQLTSSQAQLFTAQSSAFTGIGAGVNFLAKISDGVSFFAGLDTSGKYNWRVENFYTYSLGVAAGVRVERGSNTFTVGLNTHQSFVDIFHQNDYRGGFVEWSRLLDQNNKLTMFAQHFDADHPFAHQLATSLWLGGGAWEHAFEANGSRGLFSLSAYGADDHQKGTDPSVGRKFYGSRASVQYEINERMKLLAGAGVEKSNYNGVNIFFNNKIYRRLFYSIFFIKI